MKWDICNWTGLVALVLLVLNARLVSSEDNDSDLCQLPYCYRSFHKIPGNVRKSDTPQFVILTYQGYIDEAVFELIFEQIWKPKFINPDGCRSGMTLFVSNGLGHGTNVTYCSIHKLYSVGYEVALSIDSNVEDGTWDDTVVAHRDNLTVRSNLDVDHIQGLRISNEIPGGDGQFKALTTNGFMYDSSLFVVPTLMNATIHWPFTWDYSLKDLKFSVDSTQKAGVLTDAVYNYLWEVPNVRLVASEENLRQCLFIRDCLAGMTNKEDVRDKLMEMLEGRKNSKNRAPMMINLDIKTLKNKRIMQGLQLFFDTILHGEFEDIWVVGIQQMLEWVRAPVSAKSLRQENRDLTCIQTHKYHRCDPKYIREEKPRSNFRVFMDVDVLYIYQTVFLVVFYFALIRYDRMQGSKK